MCRERKDCHAILALGRSLGVQTTAEGIENTINSQWLAERGCTNGQGFLFGMPMPASVVPQHLKGGAADANERRGVERPL